MTALIVALAFWCGGAALSLAFRRQEVAATRIAVTTALAGGIAGAYAAIRVLLGAPLEVLHGSWGVPLGAFSLALDPLAAAFLAPISVLGALGALYGSAYLSPHAGERPVGTSLAVYNLLLAAMALVTVASNLILFLFAWEAMTLASYVLVVTENESRAVRRAGMLYLVSAHVATAALVMLFLLIAGRAGFEMGNLAAVRGAAPAGVLFALALVGFGTKAGVAPLHIWLPDAHAAAPGHVSALMSGVMITLGFYGLARFLPQIAPATPADAALLIALGAAGALGAIAHALVQRDVKRVLAYSTVENAGLVTLAIGLARLAECSHLPGLATLAWTAALLHIWNHAIFKSLMFLGVGAVARGAQSRDLEAWGGVLRAWPMVGALVIAGAAAMAALPGFNGFASEWLIFRGLFEGALAVHGPMRGVLVIGVGVVALTVALALSSAARLVGIGFLGRPRSASAAAPRAPGWAMTLPMLLLALLCVAGGCFAPLFARALSLPVASLVPGAVEHPAVSILSVLGRIAGLVALVTIFLAALRFVLGRGRAPRYAPTWGCAFALPTPRMQYTASSLSQPMAHILASVVRTRVRSSGPTGLWPVSSFWASQTLDRAVTDFYRPAFERLGVLTARLRGLQEARVTTYLRYVVLALLVAFALLFLPVRVRP